MTSPGAVGSSLAPSSGPLVPSSIVDLAVGELRRLILAGEFRPGERLREEELTRRWGISRPPLREALRILAADGLVEQSPRRGVRVASLTEQDVAEIYSLRYALERFAIDRGVPAARPELLAPLHEAMAAMRQAGALDDTAGVVEANREFHLGIIGLAEHRRLAQVYEQLMRQMQLCMGMNLRQRAAGADGHADSIVRHQALLDAIEGGDRADVLRAMEQHGEASFLDRLDEHLGAG